MPAGQTMHLKERITRYKAKLQLVTEEVKSDLIKYFKQANYNASNKDIQITRLKSEADINKVYAGAGFYIILTTRIFQENECTFTHENHFAIYRGHSYTTRKRISSHLANNSYRKSRKPGEPDYKVCLKIVDNINGININSKPYSDLSWIVIVHKMRQSTELIREQAELAFDEAFGKPCKSREADSRKS